MVGARLDQAYILEILYYTRIIFTSKLNLHTWDDLGQTGG